MCKLLPIRILVFTATLLQLPSQTFSQVDGFRSVLTKATVNQVQPMTGIVLWSSNEHVESAEIQLEFAYLGYDQFITGKSQYDFSALEKLLTDVSARKHQAIVRFFDTYVGKSSAIPKYIQALPSYEGIYGLSEGKKTGFPDWSHEEWQQCVLEFYAELSKRFDRDPRIAFLQVGFGLWSEYHIYDGPMQLGKTFPSKQFQSRFLKHLKSQFQDTPWMISVDAADEERSPITTDQELVEIPFGLFDDSFNHKRHGKENLPNWTALGMQRWQKAPTGGEFSFFQKIDQSKALSSSGPHGISFEEQAAKFHVSFIIGDDQPRFQRMERVKQAGMATGYRFRLKSLKTNGKVVRGTLENVGIAPIYYDAFPVVSGKKTAQSLKGLLPNEQLDFQVETDDPRPRFSIACSRLVDGQQIQWESNPE